MPTHKKILCQRTLHTLLLPANAQANPKAKAKSAIANALQIPLIIQDGILPLKT